MYLFEYLGAFYKWVFWSLVNPLLGKKAPSFKQILNPLEDSTDLVDISAGGLNNKIVGLIVTILICHLLTRVYL